MLTRHVGRVAHGGEHAQRGVDDLRSDAVSGKDDDICLHELHRCARQVRHPRRPAGLERRDLRFVLEGQPDVVEALEQPATLERVDGEREAQVAAGHRLRLEVDRRR